MKYRIENNTYVEHGIKYKIEHKTEYRIQYTIKFDFQESSATKRNGQQTPCTCKERKSVSVGSVCVLDEPWLELLADRFLLLRQRNFSVRPETFLHRGGYVLFPE